ncbi:hypothetical protein [Sinorhizobium arboris]|uniref:hypothetical protein n=1 Tax=Sinorhizobium arboris TaxID=76745 RepID=UPI00124334C2|nr:hypothetical protein [Sinorhizobium arboris]
MAVQSTKLFPLSVEAALIELRKDLSTGNFSEAHLADVVTGLSLLPPQAITWADAKIAYLAELYPRLSSRPSFLALIGLSRSKPSRSAFDHLANTPSLARLFLFHRDGYVREAALHRFSGPPETAFFLAALVYRLNDWAEPVRRAARRCAKRVFPLIAPEVVVTAAPFLLTRWRIWGRWEQEEASLVDALFEREDVNTLLVERFAQETKGALATELRYLLRGNGFDRHLLLLARHARQPNVRAVALKALIDGYATWPIGFGRKWIDKQFNLSRRIPLYAQRALTEQHSNDALISEGLRDKSAIVRRIAADALIERRQTFAGLDDVIAELGRDRSPAIRERADFLARKRSEQITKPATTTTVSKQ